MEDAAQDAAEEEAAEGKVKAAEQQRVQDAAKEKKTRAGKAVAYTHFSLASQFPQIRHPHSPCARLQTHFLYQNKTQLTLSDPIYPNSIGH